MAIYEQTMNNDVTLTGGEKPLLAGRYQVVRQLGHGGMGSVWLAEDRQLDNKPFAVKMLPSILVSNKRAYRQLKDEALVAMKLVHPNIVQIRAFEENSGNPFLVMDYIEGQTLDDYLAERGKLSEDEAVRLLKPIASALDYAHEEGVIHRDVKPANVMIRKDGHPFILDFGIAREIQETMTRVTGKLSSGTLLYMSPEQLRGQSPNVAQDVYSFAAMVYECLKGEPPFSRGQIEYQILNEQPAPLPDGISLAATIMRGLSKVAEERSQTCLAILKADAPVRVVPQMSPSFDLKSAAVNAPSAPEKSEAQTVQAKRVPKMLLALPLSGFLIALAVAGDAWIVGYRKEQEVRRKAEEYSQKTEDEHKIAMPTRMYDVAYSNKIDSLAKRKEAVDARVEAIRLELFKLGPGAENEKGYVDLTNQLSQCEEESVRIRNEAQSTVRARIMDELEDPNHTPIDIHALSFAEDPNYMLCTDATFAPVYFDYNRSPIGADESKKIVLVSDYIKRTNCVVILDGHEDEGENREFHLGWLRATQVKAYLEALGVNPGKIQVRNWGCNKPAVIGKTEQVLRMNRRCEFIFFKPKGNLE